MYSIYMIDGWKKDMKVLDDVVVSKSASFYSGSELIL